MISIIVTQLFSSSFCENELFRQLKSLHLGLRTQNDNRSSPRTCFQGFQIYYYVCVSTTSFAQVFFSNLAFGNDQVINP